MGRIVHKSNHHLCFDNQTERKNFTNKVWYDISDDLNFQEKMNEKGRKNKVQKCHDFHSYTDRKVFEPKEELDKFYNI